MEEVGASVSLNHWGIQTRENIHCFLVFGYPGETRARVVYMASPNESRRNRMFSFADLNRIPNEAYRN